MTLVFSCGKWESISLRDCDYQESILTRTNWKHTSLVPDSSQRLAYEWPVWGTVRALHQMVPGETAAEGNAMDATNRTAGPSQLQAPYKVKPQAQNLGLQGLKKRWDRKMVIICGIPQV